MAARNCGIWASGAMYFIGDVVSEDSDLYIAIQANVNSLPSTHDDDWTPVDGPIVAAGTPIAGEQAADDGETVFTITDVNVVDSDDIIVCMGLTAAGTIWELGKVSNISEGTFGVTFVGTVTETDPIRYFIIHP